MAEIGGNVAEKKFKRFYVPGMFHKLPVSFVSPEWLAKFLERKRPDYYGCYDDDIKAVFLNQKNHYEVKRHTLYHEIAHHILYTLKEMEGEEDKCDVLGRYLMDLVDAKDATEKGLKSSGKKI